MNSLDFWLTSASIDAARYAAESVLLIALASFCTYAAIRNHLIGHVRPAVAALALFLWPLVLRLLPRAYIQMSEVMGRDVSHMLLNRWYFGVNDWLFLIGTVVLLMTMLTAYPDVRRPKGE